MGWGWCSRDIISSDPILKGLLRTDWGLGNGVAQEPEETNAISPAAPMRLGTSGQTEAVLKVDLTKSGDGLTGIEVTK